MNLLKDLNDYGYIHFNHCTDERLNYILKSLGEVILITDVVVKENAKGMVTSALEVTPHTDHFDAKYILWHCIKQTSEGGDSLLVDTNIIYDLLHTNDRNKLKSINVKSHRIFQNDKDVYPLFSDNKDEGHIFYYADWLISDNDRDNKSLSFFEDILSKIEPIQFKLKENDILIIDNHRMLHGRTAVVGTKDRFLKRFWISKKM